MGQMPLPWSYHLARMAIVSTKNAGGTAVWTNDSHCHEELALVISVVWMDNPHYHA